MATRKKSSGGTAPSRRATKCLAAVAALALCTLLYHNPAPAQLSPVYSFVSFDKNYNSLAGSARSGGYQVKEEELNSPYGKYVIRAEKALSFYKEELFLFFNEKKELIYFTVRFIGAENQSRAVLDRLLESVRDKLVEKYGPGEKANYPYFKVVENVYEIVLKPRQYSSGVAECAFKYLPRFEGYMSYYTQEVQRLENEEISKTVKNF